ncbi:MAG: hypoxanthine phosphoribosyltransferase [Hyphomonadaceae bacterium]|nr:hypoxanthine phosphoribosyltransferase [Clostridia bacterium]
MIEDIEKILITEQQIEDMVQTLAQQVSEDYKHKNLMLLCVLKGSVVFAADLMRHITIPCSIDFMAVSSYGSTTSSSGVVRILKDLETDISDKDILIVEDIIDSGLTLNYLKELLLARNPKSVKICAILNKKARRKINIEADYNGYEIPDEFAVGYGLDYAEKYRNLPFVGVLKPEIYQK